MVLLIVWLAILVSSAKPLASVARRTYRIRVQSSSNGWKSIFFLYWLILSLFNYLVFL